MKQRGYDEKVKDQKRMDMATREGRGGEGRGGLEKRKDSSGVRISTSPVRKTIDFRGHDYET